MSIPKVIHYCWFGGGEFSPLMKKCMESWKKFCPDYEIIQWNESNVDLSECKYAQDALENKKWSFVSDFVRNKVIYEHGGIYLDTDVMLLKSLDPLLEHTAYAGWEDGAVATGLGFGAEKNNPLVYEFMQDYYTLDYFCEDGSVNLLIQPILTTNVLLRHGMENRDDIIQQVESFTIYPKKYFCPYDLKEERLKDTSDAYSIHYYTSSWYTEEQTKAHKKLVKTRKLERLLGKRLYKVWTSLHKLFFEGGIKAFFKNRFGKK